MTKKRMLAIVNSKKFSKFIEGTDLSKSVFTRSLLKTNRKSQCENDQHSQLLPVLNKQQNLKLKQTSFHSKRVEKADKPLCVISHISRLLVVEKRYLMDSSFLFFVEPSIEDKVNAEMRDGAIRNIQIMNKIFYELPIDIFIKSVALVDRFITKVKVKPKYMACVATACYFISAKTAEPGRVRCPSLDSLSRLSRCGGSVEDLERMTDIVLTKLHHDLVTVTSHDFAVALYWLLRRDENAPVSSFSASASSSDCECEWDYDWDRLETLLELGQQSLRVCQQRPCVLALAALLALCSADPRRLNFVRTAALLCKADLAMISQTAELLKQIYRSHFFQPGSAFSATSCRSGLVWLISKRTMSSIYGPTATTLATIDEEQSRSNGVNLDTEDWSVSFSHLFKN